MANVLGWGTQNLRKAAIYRRPGCQREAGEGEVTLQCVDRHVLIEHVYNRKEIKKNPKKLLPENKHVKYLYILYTDMVVVVRCNPLLKWKGPPKYKPEFTPEESIQHVRGLY